MAWSNNLFYIAFAGQIFLLSYYLPNKLLARMRHILKTYPPETYPKLYPKPVAHYEMGHMLFRFASRFILLLGLFLLFAVIFLVDHGSFADDGFISEAWPAAYGMLQFLPLIAVEFSEFSNVKRMREANAASKRVANLHRRSVTNMVPPALLGTAVLAFAGAILFDLYVHDFAVSLGHDTIQRALVMGATNMMLALVGLWTLYGRKKDPHLSAEDKAHHTSVTLKSLLYVSIVLSVFIAVTAADDVFNMGAVSATMISIYFQVIALLSLGYVLNNIKTDELDFDVYKEDVTAT